MNLLGITVKHAAFGSGVVAKQAGNYITVEFASKTSVFVFPDSFEKFIEAEDAEIQATIVSEIEQAKAAALLQKQREESARKTAQQQTAPTSKTKKVATLDELFSADYHVEKLARQPILTYQQVEDKFGIKITGFGRGINPTSSTVVLISSIGKSSGKFVYHDKWTQDGDYLYSGEGKTGNQTMTKGNLAIKNAKQDGKAIHLFVKFSPQEYYYQGIFDLVNYTYEDEKDENGNIRKEYKFQLRKVNGQ